MNQDQYNLTSACIFCCRASPS